MKKSFSTILIALVSFFVLSACTGYSSSEKEKFDQELQTFMKKENLKLKKTSSGVYYKVANKGSGRIIKYNDKIRVMYKGKLMDGTIFDQRNSPIEFNLRNLVPAWKENIGGKKNTGSVFYIATPPEMGYGSQENGEIPSNSCLYFEIKVMESR